LLKQVLADMKRQPTELSLILFDLDHFKQINDTLGHLAGDDVLRHMAKIIRARVRETDILCRWGGEEFIVLLKGCDLGTASNMAAELRLALMNHPCRSDHAPKQEIKINASFGVTQYQSEESKNEWLARADKALYQAKEEGRNRVVAL
jgi:diguanylate cyclase (GGDEF)-like protein